MESPRIVSRDEWLAARREHLAAEKEFTRARDALSAARRELPMVEVDKEYVLEGPGGRVSLRELFGERSQLIVYHFMFDPDWGTGCVRCSYIADNFNGTVGHLGARDISFAVISRAPLAKLEAFKARMGWDFPWLSSYGSDFNYDFHVTLDRAAGSVEYNFQNVGEHSYGDGERPGLSVFLRHGDRVLHSYSTYQRGLDLLIGAYNFIDLTPLGRHENGHGMDWLKFHDEYASTS